MKYCFGVDIGGTTVKLGLFSEAGAIVEKWEIVTRTENEGAAILPDVAEAINGKLEQHGIEKEQVLGIGVGVPAPVTVDGIVNGSANLGWKYKNAKKELEELLDMVFVTKVSMNPGKTHLRVYIESSRWIHKKNIFALEDEIERQCFPGIPMTVTVVEKFHLSEQYTPENFLESYRSSMEMELRNYNMLEYNLFRRSKITFTGKDTLPFTQA